MSTGSAMTLRGCHAPTQTPLDTNDTKTPEPLMAPAPGGTRRDAA